MWSRRPGVAEDYLEKVAKDFEKYAAETYLASLRDPEAPSHLVLAGLRYILTRNITGYDDTLMELFSSGRTGRDAREINESCVAAMFQSNANPQRLAAAFADIGTYPRPHTNARYCADGIRRLGQVGYETMFDRILAETDGKRRYRRARLLARAAKHRMPESGEFWKTADADAIQLAVNTWREQLIASDMIDALPIDDDATSNGVAVSETPTQN